MQAAAISLAPPGLHLPLPPAQAAALVAANPALAAQPGGTAALWVPPSSVGQLPLAGVDLESIAGLEQGTHVLPATPPEAEAAPAWARLVAPPGAVVLPSERPGHLRGRAHVLPLVSDAQHAEQEGAEAAPAHKVRDGPTTERGTRRVR